MMNKLHAVCPLCSDISCEPVRTWQKKAGHFKCGTCSSIFMARENLPGKEKEKERYLQHNNDVEDPGYQNFVKPVVERVTERFLPEDSGLDFGAGTGPVVTELLRKKGYNIDLYDPFFWDKPELLDQKYDYIICCEVIEHFFEPFKEFSLLESMLKPGGELICMTELYTEDKDLQTWRYLNDSTHVFLYHKNALMWIKERIGFESLEIKQRIFILKASM